MNHGTPSAAPRVAALGVSVLHVLSFWLKIERNRIYTIALAAWLIRRVIENMAKVAAAVGACYLSASHAVAGVLVKFHRALFGIIKTWPAAVSVELCTTFKKFRAARRAYVFARAVFGFVLAGKWQFGFFLAQHTVLFWR